MNTQYVKFIMAFWQVFPWSWFWATHIYAIGHIYTHTHIYDMYISGQWHSYKCRQPLTAEEGGCPPGAMQGTREPCEPWSNGLNSFYKRPLWLPKPIHIYEPSGPYNRGPSVPLRCEGWQLAHVGAESWTGNGHQASASQTRFPPLHMPSLAPNPEYWCICYLLWLPFLLLPSVTISPNILKVL